jgi:alginate O-acetyltransferase complex protein AlgI
MLFRLSRGRAPLWRFGPMLFNSPLFLFAFLPVFLVVYFALGSYGWLSLATFWLLLASLFFYGFDDPVRLTAIILASISFNYLIGRRLITHQSKPLLAVGLTGNLLLLGYFKYVNFFVQTVTDATGWQPDVAHVALPIGISFYTFTQIAFLVDAYRKEAKEYQPIRYGVFVTFFPHLIAGPIIHHKEIMPQFDGPSVYRLQPDKLALGLFWFATGLFKKAVFADNVGAYANQVFDAAASGKSLAMGDAWIGTIAYALQLYFDFSGYSDMAIGLALMIGIVFPINFNSPYQAVSLIDFWRRWNMTLSRFLRDYLYIPLGGNRRGPIRRYLNLIITMLLGGLWHGASWNFAVWGGIHGVGLLVNHAWQSLTKGMRWVVPIPLAQGLTLALVLLAWVPFRADTLHHSVDIWQAMFGRTDVAERVTTDTAWALAWIGSLSAIALFAPNSQQILAAVQEGTATRFLPQGGGIGWAAVMGTAFGIAVASSLLIPTSFLYFRF